jgi:hypothetical protein
MKLDLVWVSAVAVLAVATVSDGFNWNENVAPKLRVNYLSQQQSGKCPKPLF